jgi:hypothetical protein
MNWLAYLVLAVSIWMIMLACFAIYETAISPGPAYTTFVKWFASLSVAAGVIVFIVDVVLLSYGKI